MNVHYKVNYWYNFVLIHKCAHLHDRSLITNTKEMLNKFQAKHNNLKVYYEQKVCVLRNRRKPMHQQYPIPIWTF